MEWVRSDPWRVATIALGIALIISLVLLATDDSKPGSEDGDAGAIPTGTTVTNGGSTGTTVDPGDSGAVLEGKGGLVAIKIDNAPASRPQVGIAQAPLLIETPVEGGMTRFVAVFGDDATGVVGPVRSIRPVDPVLLPLMALNVVSTGGQPFVLQDMDASSVQHIFPTIYPDFISGGKEPPHDAFIDLGDLIPLLSGGTETAPGLPIGNLPETTGRAELVKHPLGGVDFRLEDGVYQRYQDGAPYTVAEGLSGGETALAHDTLVFMFVAQRSAGYEDSNGATVPTFDVVGGGRLMVFHDGEVADAFWRRDAREDPFRFFDGSGRPFGLPEGRLYLGLIPRELSVEYE